MNRKITPGEDELDVIRHLVIELATEVDMHYRAVEASAIRTTVAAIAAGRMLLARKGALVPDDVDAILAKFDPSAGGDRHSLASPCRMPSLPRH